MEKKPYNMERKNQATTKILLRGLVCGYLLYLAWQLAFEGGEDPSFPVAARIAAAVFFAVAATAFLVYSWKRYRADCKAAQEMAEEAEEPEALPEADDGSGENL